MLKKSWYIIQVYSGFEKKVVQAIQEQAEKKGLQDRFEELLVPSEETIEVSRGKKVIKEHHYFPGYILAKMHLDDDVWHLVRSVPRVSSFLGSRGKPMRVSENEVARIMKRVKEDQEQKRYKINYNVGDQVRVNDGPFSTFVGSVEDVDVEKERLRVSVTIFGRPTTLDLEFVQVERI